MVILQVIAFDKGMNDVEEMILRASAEYRDGEYVGIVTNDPDIQDRVNKSIVNITSDASKSEKKRLFALRVDSIEELQRTLKVRKFKNPSLYVCRFTDIRSDLMSWQDLGHEFNADICLTGIVE